jgi:hypothetical protein
MYTEYRTGCYYDQTIVNCVNEEEEEEEKKIYRIRICYLWHHTHIGEAITTRNPSKQKSACMCNWRRNAKVKERERENTKKSKKNVWMEFDACIYGSNSSTTKFQFVLPVVPLSSCSFLVLDYIIHRRRREEKKKSIFNI